MSPKPLVRPDYAQLARQARRAQAIYIGQCIAAVFAAIGNAFQKERGSPRTCSAT